MCDSRVQCETLLLLGKCYLEICVFTAAADLELESYTAVVIGFKINVLCGLIFESFYHQHMDFIVLSVVFIHRIRTYRKISPWTSHSRDIMQTVSRYYSNAFTGS